MIAAQKPKGPQHGVLMWSCQESHPENRRKNQAALSAGTICALIACNELFASKADRLKKQMPAWSRLAVSTLDLDIFKTLPDGRRLLLFCICSGGGEVNTNH